MRKALHTRHAALALMALVLAAGFPMALPSTHEYAPSAEVVMMDARASSDAEVVAVMPSATLFTGGATRNDGDVAQTAAMLLVGTLLIAVGSVVRRVV